jgi:hypothetical protein
MVQVEEDDNDGAPPGYRHIKTVVRSGGHWLNSRQVNIPPGLKPSDFDWKHSRPTELWLTTFASSFADPRIGEEPERRKIDLIELRVSDVTNIFAPASILPSVAQPREIAPKQNPSNQGLRKITAGYIDEEKKAGRIPTKKGLEARAKSMNIRGNRQHLRDMFTELWPGAPGVGRPKKFAN